MRECSRAGSTLLARVDDNSDRCAFLKLSTRGLILRAYLASSLKNQLLNAEIDSRLSALGIDSFLPERDAEGPASYLWKASDDIARRIFAANVKGIDAAEVVLVVARNMGTDTAWECGYASATGKRVIFLLQEGDSIDSMYMVCGGCDPGVAVSIDPSRPQNLDESVSNLVAYIRARS